MKKLELRNDYRVAPGWQSANLEQAGHTLIHRIRSLQIVFSGHLGEATKELLAILTDCNMRESTLLDEVTTSQRDALVSLQEVGVVWQTSRLSSDDMFSRNIKFWELFSERPSDAIETHIRLQNSKVALLGVGGFGSWLAYLLAGSGVGSLTLIDDDFVEASNLSRQPLFTIQDLGLPKVEVARSRLLASFPKLSIQTVMHRVAAPEDIKIWLDDQTMVIAPIGLPSPDTSVGGVTLALLDACGGSGSSLMFAGSGFVGPIMARPSVARLTSILARPTIANRIRESPTARSSPIGEPQPALASRLAITAGLCAWEATRYLSGLRSYAVEQIVAVDTIHYLDSGFSIAPSA